MAPFRFNELPMELRLQVWKEALLEESSNRIVFLDVRLSRVIPTKHLASPLLSVNYESRKCALEFFTMTLNVKRLLEPVGYESFFVEPEVGGPPYISPVIASHYIEDGTHGVLYLSPRYDIFFVSFKLTAFRTGLDEDRHTEDWCLEWATSDGEEFIYTQTDWLLFADSPGWVTGYADHYSSQIERVLALRNEYPFSPSEKWNDQSPEHFVEETIYTWNKEWFDNIQQYLFYSYRIDWEDWWLENWVEHLIERQPGEPLPAQYSVAAMRELPWTLQLQQDGSERRVLDVSRFVRDPEEEEE
ncbi:hypothetical protein F4820DRAFT_79433 [Hypoxylon rubiginosum]|uniref:Uncharacterized protein n=1 Tax=Hypoxylon rubiginosum TaxID=110542 RepID=A0ACB9YPN5_9PEZI|nr:hypothetical protein F4820DRAFT_79433 [Hypoxylon rubiginosum]